MIRPLELAHTPAGDGSRYTECGPARATLLGHHRFLRLPQILSVIPLGKTSWWAGVRSGRFPKPIKLSARCTAWRAEEIRELIKHLSDGAPQN